MFPLDHNATASNNENRLAGWRRFSHLLRRVGIQIRFLALAQIDTRLIAAP